MLRKSYKPYMGRTVEAESVSITTGAPQTLYLDGKDQPLLRDRDAVLVDDVNGTGSTVEAMRSLAERAGGRVIAEAAVFTERDAIERDDGVVALGQLPVCSPAGHRT